MTTGPSLGQIVALTDGTRARLPGAMPVRPTLPRPVPDSMLMAGWITGIAAIIAVGAAAAVRWPTATTALAYRAGHAAGLAWATLCSFAAWLLDSLKRMIG